MCGRVRLSNDYFEIKIRLRFDAQASSAKSLRVVEHTAEGIMPVVMTADDPG